MEGPIGGNFAEGTNGFSRIESVKTVFMFRDQIGFPH